MYNHNSHSEKIICPSCNEVQNAEVVESIPFWIYIHECKCGHIIMESEWKLADPLSFITN